MNTKNYIIAGQNLVKLREKKGLSRADFAYTVNLPESYIYEIECGEGIPTLNELFLFCLTLDCRAYDIVPFPLATINDIESADPTEQPELYLDALVKAGFVIVPKFKPYDKEARFKLPEPTKYYDEELHLALIKKAFPGPVDFSYVSIGQNLKRIMRSSSFSARTIYTRTGITKERLMEIISGMKHSVSELYKISCAMNISIWRIGPYNEKIRELLLHDESDEDKVLTYIKFLLEKGYGS